MHLVFLQATHFFIHYLFAKPNRSRLPKNRPWMHYSSGLTAVQYGAYEHNSPSLFMWKVFNIHVFGELPHVFKIGFMMVTINAIICGVAGILWWKFLCLY
ncbi:hypothetical protein BRARA_B03891 [Brassica rapa]|uniref:Uncharacterized protein n=1 Tax=Brassica campestris TaxID=3711 RepID=A0A398ANN3_BRACM|nr:hypothetical protein BRARA_B03891 [Brassica rapa]